MGHPAFGTNSSLSVGRRVLYFLLPTQLRCVQVRFGGLPSVTNYLCDEFGVFIVMLPIVIVNAAGTVPDV